MNRNNRYLPVRIRRSGSKIITCVLGLLLASGINSCKTADIHTEGLSLIPAPKEVRMGRGYFKATPALSLVAADSLRPLFAWLNKPVFFWSGDTLSDHPESKCRIALTVVEPEEGHGPESYRLSIKPEKIEITASATAGIFYGLQTLCQLLDDERYYDTKEKIWRIPVMEINDEPAFPYRGVMLDVSRHLFPKEKLKEWIGWLAYYKINTLHWHLTDAAGWRIEMERYPELTQKAAWRTESDWRKWWDGGDRRYSREGDSCAYGGYYTREDIREIVAFAAKHHIEVIPEIEMPGHSEEVLAVYPELRCAGHPHRQGEFCIGNEQSFEFIENVLTEVMDLFPSHYIHIGGDEAGTASWAQCPRCRQRKKEEGLKTEKELQSYLIRRVGAFLAQNGRRFIGWDEILEGGLAPGAVVMSWRGEQGGIAAVRAGHAAIMTPGSYCYWDSYQDTPDTQPYAIGGFTTYLKVYSYDPVPDSLQPEEARRILGAQGNIFTEYIETPEHLEYMLFPRLLSLSEVVWSPRGKRHEEDFKYRVENHVRHLHRKGINAFPLSDRIDFSMETDTMHRCIRVTLDTERYQPEIRYTLDGTPPDGGSPRYTAPLQITDSARICAAIFRNGIRSETLSHKRVDYHRAIGKEVFYHTRWSDSYPAAGKRTFADGYRGGLTYGDGHWQGFLSDIDVTIDLGEDTDLHYLSAGFMQLTGPGVYMPHYVQISLSGDGSNFTEIARIDNRVPSGDCSLRFQDYTARFRASGRYVRLFAKRQRGFQFLDEIVVY